ncbi:MAG: hypothetical protein CL946_02620 [Ectothiorhodospiraceae bacterium]|nr:hypothetical protein [Ectothiorhodospiraceae bacterium]
MDRIVSISIGVAVVLTLCVVHCTQAVAQWNHNPDQATPICTAPSQQTDPVIIGDGVGGVIIVWADYRNLVQGEIFGQRVTADGNPLWGIDGKPIHTGSDPVYYPTIVASEANTFIVVWLEQGHESEFVAQKIDREGSGLWGNGVRIPTGAGTMISKPRVVTDKNGGAIIAWATQSTSGSNLYTQKIGPGGQIRWVASGLLVQSNIQGLDSFAMETDQNGGIYLAWEDTFQSSPNIFAQRISSNGLPLWDQHLTHVSPNDSAQINPVLSSTSSGELYIVWEDYRHPSEPNHLYIQYMDDSGGRNWGNGKQIPLSNGCVNFEIAVNRFNACIVVWEREIGFSHKVYGQYIDQNGTMKWDSQLSRICSTVSNQRSPRIVTDGWGGVIIVWADSRNGFSDLYGQRIHYRGYPVWSSTGVAVCTAPNSEQGYVLSRSTNGEVVVVWIDKRDGSQSEKENIYASKVDGQGRLYPVELMSFSAHLLDDGVYLDWRTASEVNNFGFAVERRADADGEDWEEIGFVAGNGTVAEARSFTFLDDDIESLRKQFASVSYRIIQEDYSGEREVSAETSISFVPLNASSIQLYPNPAPTSTTLRLTLHQDAQTSVSIYTIDGRQVFTRELGSLQQGVHLIDLSAEVLPVGMSFLHVTTGNDVLTSRLLHTP